MTTKQYSQKYTVVCFFEPQQKVSKFSALDWPLHITILDTFKTNWTIDELWNALAKTAASLTSFDVTPFQETMLGENHDVSVKLIRQDKPLLALHRKLLSLTDEGSFVFNSPEFVGEGFLPHATDQSHSQVEIGKPYPIESMSLVDMFPDADHMQRVVVDTFNFNRSC